MQRLYIGFTEKQIEFIRLKARRKSISDAAFVRQCIEAELQENGPPYITGKSEKTCRYAAAPRDRPLTLRHATFGPHREAPGFNERICKMKKLFTKNRVMRVRTCKKNSISYLIGALTAKTKRSVKSVPICMAG